MVSRFCWSEEGYGDEGVNRAVFTTDRKLIRRRWRPGAAVKT